MKLGLSINEKIRELIDVYMTNTPVETSIFNDKKEKDDKNTYTKDSNFIYNTKDVSNSDTKDANFTYNTSTINNQPHNTDNPDSSSFVDKMINRADNFDDLIAMLKSKKKNSKESKEVMSSVDTNEIISNIVDENPVPSNSDSDEDRSITDTNEIDIEGRNTISIDIKNAISDMTSEEKDEITEAENNTSIVVNKFDECTTLDQANTLLLKLKGIHGDLHPRKSIGGVILTSYIYCIERLAYNIDGLKYDYISEIVKDPKKYISNFSSNMKELNDFIISTDNVYKKSVDYMINVVSGDVVYD